MDNLEQAVAQAQQLLQAGRRAAAQQLCEQILKEDFQCAEAWHLRGVSVHQCGDNPLALQYLRQAIQISPGKASYHYNLGVVLNESGDQQGAEAEYRRTIQLDSDFVSALVNLAGICQLRGRFSEAVELNQRALLNQPDQARHHANLAMALKMQGDLAASLRHYRDAVQLEPHNAQIHSGLLFTSQYAPSIDQRALLAEHHSWELRHAQPLHREQQPLANRPEPDRPLRIGLVSPDLGNHPVGFFLAPVLQRLEPAMFHTTCYSDRSLHDECTRRLLAAAGQWRQTSGVTDEALAQQIRLDHIDLLLDLAGHTDHNRLLVFARRPAPIQLTWAGYVGTTGLSAMDYLLCDRFHVPLDCCAELRETPLRLPDSYVSYEPPPYAPAVGPLPAAINDYVTFGSFNNPSKVNEKVVEVWSAILRAVPGARLALKYRGCDDPGVQRRFLEMFAKQGIAAERLEMHGETLHGDHLRAYHDVDIALDPFPYSGGLTTCESLWMGVPVITYPQERFSSRHSLSYLSSVGLTATIATSLDHYVDLAKQWAGDRERLSRIRADLRPMMARSPLCDLDRFADHFAQMLRSVWAQWCRSEVSSAAASGGPLPAIARTIPSCDTTLLQGIIEPLPTITVVDVGASDMDGPPVYANWLGTERMRLVGFEPMREEFQKLRGRRDPHATYLPDAIGDGQTATLHICAAPGMTSLLEPNLKLLKHFHGFEEWSQVIRREPVETKRLDDLELCASADFLTIDVQGSELDVLRGAAELLKRVVAVQVEVNFVPFYLGQPLFAELDLAMRQAGFWLHALQPMVRRTFKPLLVEGDIYNGINQVLWSDALYVRPFTQFSELTVDQLWRIAQITHDLYRSYDLAALAIGEIDRRQESQWQSIYFESMRFSSEGAGA